MYDPDETPFDRDETPFDGDRETRRIDAALDRLDTGLADMGARLDRLEAVLDRLNGRLDRMIRTRRRLFLAVVLGLTVELGLMGWILVRLRSRGDAMGRSRRHTPITGVTKSTSDTRDKVLAHRRRAGDVWSFAKDGQRRFDPRRWPPLVRT